MIKMLKNGLLAIGWMIGLHFLLLFPGSQFREEPLVLIPNMDKLVHALLYAGLVASICFYLANRYPSQPNKLKKLALLVLVLAIADGIVIEFLQGTPLIHRDFDWYDALADGIGAVAGYIFFWRSKERILGLT
ncbi:VanZ family protein [Flavihumibacter rivuli]|uniref:VanZ family protein n=1 Tax=Flavihumibacter rivuli TaxID=2838156 RepID=UPI001BDF643C|nr:VanZ family protein [Flavihumibacter rivuli]ULQ55090.1 VanZ family protein [Flavihumibacter rivuli]